MKYRKDKNGDDLSMLGFGCMRFARKGGKIDIDEAERVGAAAVDHAIMGDSGRMMGFRRISNEPYRIDALAAYLGALKLETRNLRMITVGRRSGTDKETIRELLRLTGRI